MKPPSQGEPPQRDIAIHIFAASAAMVGVCLTVISIVRSITREVAIHHLVDDMLAVNAMMFLASCLLSYGALRVRHKRRAHRLEAASDVVFLTALLGLVIACGTIVWAVV